MIVLCGASASGKTSIVEEMKKRGWTKIVTYTTRPPRNGEIDGIDYYFITKEEFICKINKDFFAEYKVYESILGKWYYGTSKEDLLGNNKVIILTPDGLKCIKDSMPLLKIVSFYIDVNLSVQKERLIQRGDNKYEIDRRISSDIIDFENINNEIDFTIPNNGDLSLEEIVDMIIYSYYGVKEFKIS